MKKVIASVLAAVFATSVYAACSTHTYVVNGKMVVCTTCCTGSSCNTTCF